MVITTPILSVKNMNSFKGFAVVGSLLSLLACNVQAIPVTANADTSLNPVGPFAYLQPFTQWSSGDIALPSGTIIGSTPFEISLALLPGQELTLDNAPSGSQHYSFGFNFTSLLPAGTDAGTIMMELTQNGTVITSQFGFGWGSFGSDEPGYATGGYENLPNNLVFNGVNIYVSDSAPRGVGVSDIIIGLDTVQGVPDTTNTLPLLFLGLVAMFGFGYRKVDALRSQL